MLQCARQDFFPFGFCVVIYVCFVKTHRQFQFALIDFSFVVASFFFSSRSVYVAHMFNVGEVSFIKEVFYLFVFSLPILLVCVFSVSQRPIQLMFVLSSTELCCGSRFRSRLASLTCLPMRIHRSAAKTP